MSSALSFQSRFATPSSYVIFDDFTAWEQLTNNTGQLGRLSSRELASLRSLLRSAMLGAVST